MSTAPICFMHVQKTGGQSLHAALAAALPPDALARQRSEAANFCNFNHFDQLEPHRSGRIAVSDADISSMGRHRAVFGHFTLPTLLRLAPPERIATVLREPRARLLSYYLFLRFKVALRTLWAPYGIHRSAEGSLLEFLLDRRVAKTTDNRVCRMLLHGDPRLPEADFIAPPDLEGIAEAAWQQLERLGYVGLIEEPEAVWTGVGAHFGVVLTPVRKNVTGDEEMWPGMLPVPPFGGSETLELLECRSAADGILYRRMAAKGRSADAVGRLVDGAFAEALVRFGSFTAERGHGAAQPKRSSARIAALRQSRSWHYTRPIRNLVKRLR